MLAWLRTAPLLALCALGLLLAGCGGGGGTAAGADPTVYFINGSADAGEIDWFINAVLRAGAQDFKESSADFTTLPFVSDGNGGYDIEAKETANGNVLDAENRPLFRDTHTAFVSVGLKTFVQGEELKRFRIVDVDVNRKAPNGNKARLYIVHGFVREVGQATPKIIFQNAGDNPQFATSPFDFGTSVSLIVDSGTMDWWAKRDEETSNVVYASATVTLDPSSVYIVLVGGIENDPDPNKQPSLTFIKVPTL